MNSMCMEYVEDETYSKEECVEDAEYVDLEIIDLAKIQEEAQLVHKKYRVIQQRYAQSVPQIS